MYKYTKVETKDGERVETPIFYMNSYVASLLGTIDKETEEPKDKSEAWTVMKKV